MKIYPNTMILFHTSFTWNKKNVVSINVYSKQYKNTLHSSAAVKIAVQVDITYSKGSLWYIYCIVS